MSDFCFYAFFDLSNGGLLQFLEGFRSLLQGVLSVKRKPCSILQPSQVDRLMKWDHSQECTRSLFWEQQITRCQKVHLSPRSECYTEVSCNSEHLGVNMISHVINMIGLHVWHRFMFQIKRQFKKNAEAKTWKS